MVLVGLMFAVETCVALTLTLIEAEALESRRDQGACVRWLYAGRAFGALCGGRLASTMPGTKTFAAIVPFMIALGFATIASRDRNAYTTVSTNPRRDVVGFLSFATLAGLAPTFGVPAYYYYTGRLGFTAFDMGVVDMIFNTFVFLGGYVKMNDAFASNLVYAGAQTVAAASFYFIVHRTTITGLGVPDEYVVYAYTAMTAVATSMLDAEFASRVVTVVDDDGVRFTIINSLPKVSRVIGAAIGLGETHRLGVDHDDFSRAVPFARECLVGTMTCYAAVAVAGLVVEIVRWRSLSKVADDAIDLRATSSVV
jgi:uncharacterized membrane protein YfcA